MLDCPEVGQSGTGTKMPMPEPARVPKYGDPVLCRNAPVPDWDAGCQYADAGCICPDVVAMMCLKMSFFFGWNILTGGFGDLENNSLPSPLPPTRHMGICPKRKYLWGVRGQNTQPFNREGSRLKRIVLAINKDFLNFLDEHLMSCRWCNFPRALKRTVSWDGLGFFWIDLRP